MKGDRVESITLNQRNLMLLSELGVPILLKERTKLPENDGIVGGPPKNIFNQDQRWDKFYSVFDNTESIIRSVENAERNWGMVPNPEYIVIDIDLHDKDSSISAEDKKKIFLEMVDQGWLPDTLHVSRRFEDDPYSGHYWYKIPNGFELEADEETRLVTADNSSIGGKVYYNGVHLGEVKHCFSGQVVMPGSIVDGMVYEAQGMLVAEIIEDTASYDVEYEIDEDIQESVYVAEMHPAMWENIKKKYAPVILAKQDPSAYSQREKDQVHTQFCGSLLAYIQASPGSRDDFHMKVCRDLGSNYAVGNFTDDELKEHIELINDTARRLAKEANDQHDQECIPKTQMHVSYGQQYIYLNSSDTPGEEWWFQEPALKDCYYRAGLYKTDPYGLLLMELLFLAASTDHRIKVASWDDESNIIDTGALISPMNMWLLIYGVPGTGKSSAWTKTVEASKYIIELSDPPVHRSYFNESGERYVTDPEKITQLDKSYARSKPVISGLSTKNGVAELFTTGSIREKIHNNYRAVVHMDEPDLFFNRQSSEYGLIAQLLSTFFSPYIRNTVARQGGSYELDKNSYSLSLIVNCPPKSITKFHELRGSGTYERFLMCSMEMDPKLARSIRELKNDKPDLFHPPYMDIVKQWTPYKKSSLMDEERSTILYSDSDTIKELEEVDFAVKSNTPLKELAELGYSDYLPLLDVGIDAISAWQHMSIKIQRLSAVLSRYCGEELPENESWVIPRKYFDYAKLIIHHSASVLAMANQEVKRREDVVHDIKIKQTKDKAAARIEGEMQAELSAHNVMLKHLIETYERLSEKSKEVTFLDYYNSVKYKGKKNKWFTNATQCKDILIEHELCETDALMEHPSRLVWIDQ